MPLVQAHNDRRVFLDEDCSLDEISEDFVGRKALSLFALREMDVPVPPFFALSGSIFTEYVTECLNSKITGKSTDEEIRDKITGCTFSSSVRNEIMNGYSRLSGFAEAWVSIRSSVILPPSHRDLAFSGLLGTELNVRGSDQLMSAIKKVYSSAFTSTIAHYLSANNLTLADIKVGIVVQKMIQAEASGALFTIDPISQNPGYLTIEAVFGLGDVIASGDITPDQYIIDKKSLEFVEKKIVPQEWMMVRKISPKDKESGDQKVQISKAWQQQQKLENRYIKELAQIAIIAEKKSKQPLDLEWVFEGGRIWLLQSSPVHPVTLPKSVEETDVQIEPSIVEAAQEIAHREEAKKAVKEEIERKKSLKEDVFTAKPFTRQVLKPRKKKEKTKGRSVIQFSPLPGEKLLITGIGASGTSFRGTTVVITDAVNISKKKRKLNKDAILVLSDHIPEVGPFLTKVGAVIMDTGGMTSDIATICRERGIPCIMGTHISSRMLKEGENILVDGTIGAIYGIREQISQLSVPQKIEAARRKPDRPKPSPSAKQTPSPAKLETISPSMIQELPQKVSTPRTATKLYLDLSDSYLKGKSWKDALPLSDGVLSLQMEDLYKEFGRHPEAYLQNSSASELVKKLSSRISDLCELAQDRPVVIQIGSLPVSEYKNLTKGTTFEKLEKADLTDQTRGLPRLLEHPKELTLFFKTIRHVRNSQGWRTVSIAVNYASTPARLIEFKKLMSSSGLRRSSTLNVFTVVSTPSEAMIANEFVKAGTDGIIIDLKPLTSHMMAPDYLDDSVMKVVEQIRDSNTDTHIILKLPDDAVTLVKTAVRLGFHGISIGPSKLEESRKTLVEEEREAIFKK